MSTDAVGGVWTFADDLRAELANSGVEVVLATLGPEPPLDGGLWLECRLEWQDDPWDDVHLSGDWLREQAYSAGADVVHLNGYAHAARAWRAPVVVTAHSCVLSWHEAVRGTPAGPRWERYRDAVAAGLRAADAVVAPTAAMRGALRRHYGCDRCCRVIPNGVAPHLAAAAPREPFVRGAGRLCDEAKGLDTLDEAAAGLPWPIEVAGDAGTRRAGHVRLLGRLARDDLRARMARATIFAHPARYEPFGLAVLEAALAGCVLVLGDIDSLREQWDEAAVCVTPGDRDDLRATLEWLIADDTACDALARASQLRARRRTRRAMAAAYLELYSQLRERWVVYL